MVALAILFFIALVFRVGYVALSVGFDSPPTFDGLTYTNVATSLVAGQGFASGGTATAFRPPGYPVFLAIILKAFGSTTTAPRLANILLGSALVLPTFAIAMRIFQNRWISFLTGLGVAVHPILVYLVGLIYPETLSLFLLVTMLWLLYVQGSNVSRWLAATTGILSGSLVMMRPSILLLMPFVALWFGIRGITLKRGVAYVALFLALVALPIGTWTIRNWLTFGDIIPLATEGGVTFWEGNHPLGNGGVIEPSAETWLGPNPPAGIEGWSGLSEKESETRFYDAAFSWIRDNPLPFLRLLPLKLYRGLSLAFGNEARSSASPGWLSAGYFFVLLLALLGIVLSWKHRHALLLCYGVLFAVFGTMLVFYGSSRQSALAVPVLMMFLAYSLENILRRLHGLRKSFFVAKPSLEA